MFCQQKIEKIFCSKNLIIFNVVKFTTTGTKKVRQQISYLFPLFSGCWIRNLRFGMRDGKNWIRDKHPGSETHQQREILNTGTVPWYGTVRYGTLVLRPPLFTGRTVVGVLRI